MRRPLARLVKTLDLDIVHFEHLYLVELLPAVSDLPAVVGEQNVEFDAIRRLYGIGSNPVHRIRDYLAYRRMLSFETRWIREFPVCLAVSEEDARLLSTVCGKTEVHLVPNGVDSQSFVPPGDALLRHSSKVLFFGTLSYGPNRDGVIHFCEKVWPVVHSSRPDATLEVVGIDPPPDVLALGKLPGVEVVGFRYG